MSTLICSTSLAIILSCSPVSCSTDMISWFSRTASMIREMSEGDLVCCMVATVYGVCSLLWRLLICAPFSSCVSLPFSSWCQRSDFFSKLSLSKSSWLRHTATSRSSLATIRCWEATWLFRKSCSPNHSPGCSGRKCCATDTSHSPAWMMWRSPPFCPSETISSS